MAVVRILGIDPGTVVVGFGCIEMGAAAAPRATALPPMGLRAANVVRLQNQGDLRVIDAGTLRLGRRGDAMAERLCQLALGFAALLDRLAPGEIALEEAFFGKSVQSALRIGEARGVVLAEAGRRGLPVHQFAPSRVKRCITGKGSADKATVAAMLRQLLPPVVFTAADAAADTTDALAVALTRAEVRRSPLLAAQWVAEVDAAEATGRRHQR